MTARRAPDARLAAVRALSEVLDSGRQLGDCRSLDAGLDARDAAFARRLAYGTLRWYVALDALATDLLERPLKARERDVHRLLLLGLYQLWHEDTEAHAAVHATAEVARALRKPWAVGLVNAVLRRFQREREQRLTRLGNQEASLAHPDWLLERLKADWPRHWRAVAAANNAEPPLWLRANTLRQSTDDLARALGDAGFDARRHPDITTAVEMRPPAPVDRIPGFSDGLCSVQDAAAQWAATLVKAQPGQRVLDACAAPGGKTGHLLEHTQHLDLTALDLQPQRLERVQENLDRLGLSAHLLAADASQPDAWWSGEAFDRILLDAPCSATGVIRRHPEIRLLRTPEDVAQVIRLQAKLLDALWPLLRPGGMLVYATCSVLRCENSEQIQKFLDRTDDADCTGPPWPDPKSSDPGRQILPGESGMDGFYYATLLRRA